MQQPETTTVSPSLVSWAQVIYALHAFSLVTGILESGMQSGEFRRNDPAVVARMLGPMLLMHALWCTHRDLFKATANKTDEQVLDEVLSFYLHAIRSSPAEAPGALNASTQ